VTPREAVVRFYIDADILGLAKVLADLRNDITRGDPGTVIYKRRRPACPITSPEVLDPDWIPEVASRGWLIVTRDSKIITNHPCVPNRYDPDLAGYSLGRSAPWC
jgi:hypothetical protein